MHLYHRGTINYTLPVLLINKILSLVIHSFKVNQSLYGPVETTRHILNLALISKEFFHFISAHFQSINLCSMNKSFSNFHVHQSNQYCLVKMITRLEINSIGLDALVSGLLDYDHMGRSFLATIEHLTLRHDLKVGQSDVNIVVATQQMKSLRSLKFYDMTYGRVRCDLLLSFHCNIHKISLHNVADTQNMSAFLEMQTSIHSLAHHSNFSNMTDAIKLRLERVLVCNQDTLTKLTHCFGYHLRLPPRERISKLSLLSDSFSPSSPQFIEYLHRTYHLRKLVLTFFGNYSDYNLSHLNNCVSIEKLKLHIHKYDTRYVSIIFSIPSINKLIMSIYHKDQNEVVSLDDNYTVKAIGKSYSRKQYVIKRTTPHPNSSSLVMAPPSPSSTTIYIPEHPTSFQSQQSSVNTTL
ncbi:hypothetical protein SAMD00019534_018140, partial [Acytostelium subglobosum LB1]|uniref:hypothetical protein n=1 Tax=Acytostelium subglobosum LB1 TaxID=1410327 RepID=UPI000644879B